MKQASHTVLDGGHMVWVAPLDLACPLRDGWVCSGEWTFQRRLQQEEVVSGISSRLQAVNSTGTVKASSESSSIGRAPDL